jgi:hypothetical protein
MSLPQYRSVVAFALHRAAGNKRGAMRYPLKGTHRAAPLRGPHCERAKDQTEQLRCKNNMKTTVQKKSGFRERAQSHPEQTSKATLNSGARDSLTTKRTNRLGELIICELELRSRIAQTTGNLDQLWQLITALDSLVDVVANEYAWLKRFEIRNTIEALDNSQNDGGQGDE